MASKGYEENYFFVRRSEGIYYNELETRVRLTKRRLKAGQQPSNSKLVKHRPLNKNEHKMQRNREKHLEPIGEDDEEEEELSEEEEEEKLPETTERAARSRSRSGSRSSRSRSGSRSKSRSRSRSRSKSRSRSRSGCRSRSRSRSRSAS